MLFSRDTKPRTDEPKNRSLLGKLFNPNVGTEIGPFFEAGRMFVRMVAYILASYKLFPKDHPFFDDDKVRLSFADLFRISYRRLSFTREGIPQIVLFAAVFGCLLFSALFIVTLILSTLMGSAHAQEVFQAPNADSDWALKWIDYLFLGKDISIDGSMSTQATGCEIQKAMGSALSIYSSAVLVLAGFLLMYHLVFMIAEQAHTGKLMGKAHQIWAPIRLVFAIGMLVPITTTTTSGTCNGSISGYNTAQYVAAQVARWGSGLGSRVWEGFVKTLASEQVPSCDSTSTSDDQELPKNPSCITPPVVISDILESMILMESCSYLFNHYLDVGGYKESNIGTFYQRPAMYVNHIDELKFTPASGKFKAQEAYLGIRTDDNTSVQGGKFDDFLRRDASIICGGFEIPVYTSSDYDDVVNAQYAVLARMAIISRIFAEKWMPYFIPGKTSVPYGDVQDDMEKDFVKYKTAYQKAMNENVQSALTKADDAVKKKTSELLSNARYTSSGWLTAGAWFTTIAKLQAVRSIAVRGSLPTFVRPSIFRASKTGEAMFKWANMTSIPATVAASLKNLQNALAFNQSYPYTGLTSSDEANAYESQMIDLGNTSMEKKGKLNSILSKIDQILGEYTVWNSFSTLGIKFGVTANPIAEIAAFGQNCVESGLTIMGYGFLGGALFGLLPYIGAGLMVISSFITTVGTIMATIGFTLGYIVPLYPFYRFFFGSMIWVMTVFEAIVLAPLFALAHIEPHGEGLAGKRGQYGYNIAIQLLLRPTLMVFGLIAGYLIFKVALMFLNEAFVYATSGTGAYGGSMPVIAKIIYTIIYCALVVILANQAFSPIGLFPQTALKWLGLGGVTEERIADTGLVTTAAAAGASHISGKLAAAGQGVAQIGQSAVKGIKDYGDNKEKERTEEATKKRLKDEQKFRDEMRAVYGLRGGQDPNIPSQQEPPYETPPINGPKNPVTPEDDGTGGATFASPYSDDRAPYEYSSFKVNDTEIGPKRGGSTSASQKPAPPKKELPDGKNDGKDRG